MQYPKIIQNALEYIEQNLKTEITAEELARKANYSTCYYCRLFSSAVGSPVAGYILERRIDHALDEIACGRKAIEVVLEYGFDTYAGFYKAFVKLYGCSPKKYLRIYQAHKPTKPEVPEMKTYTKNELRKILSNWDVPQNLPIEEILIANGERADETEWRIGGSYLLKTGNRIQRIRHLKIAKTLGKNGFPSCLPVPTKTGDDFLEGDEIFVLSHAGKGAPLSREKLRGEHRSQYAREYGVGIAKLHKALKKIQSDINPDPIDLYQNVMEWALPSVRLQNRQWNLKIDESFFKEYGKTFGPLCARLPKQLIHRNPCPSYIYFEGERVSGFEDFDLSECNVRLWDPCYCATGILSEGDDEITAVWLNILQELLRGYDRENPLSQDEKHAVYDVICSIQMICVAYFEGCEEYRELARTNRQMLQFVIQNKQRIDHIFE
jgi:AraC-type DNA-binding domain-containing proteins